MRRVLTVLVAGVVLGGCELLGIPNPEKEHAAKEAEGKAVGAACRHAGRAIEDCYVLNPKALKSAVFVGWREMNDYMRENKIDSAKPELAGKMPEGDQKAEKKVGRAPGSDGFPAPAPLIKPRDPEEGNKAGTKEAEKTTSATEKTRKEERADRSGKAVIDPPSAAVLKK